MEKFRYIAGAERKGDGTYDYSRALVWKRESGPSEKRKAILTADEIQHWIHTLNDSSFCRTMILNMLAKEKGVSADEILFEFCCAAKRRIKETNKGDLKHYHRTSLENLRNILKSKALLSRAEVERRYPCSIRSWSSSDNIMMTRDKFDSSGKLVIPGYTLGEGGLGAAGDGVVFIFKHTIMDRNDYDATRRYPEIAEIPLPEYCEAILVGTIQDLEATKQLLEQYHLAIPVMLASQWRRSEDAI